MYGLAIFFDIVRMLLGGTFIALGFVFPLLGAVAGSIVPIAGTIIGGAIGTPIGIALGLLGATLSILLSLIAFGVFLFIYHSHHVSLLDRVGAKMFKSLISPFLSWIPLVPWTFISVLLVVRAVQKEDREYTESRSA